MNDERGIGVIIHTTSLITKKKKKKKKIDE